MSNTKSKMQSIAVSYPFHLPIVLNNIKDNQQYNKSL